MGGHRVTNMADGVNPYDAVNKRQLDRAYGGIAAMASIPGVAAGKSPDVHEHWRKRINIKIESSHLPEYVPVLQ